MQKAAPNSGLVNFYRGFSPTLLGMIPYAGMSFLTHDSVGDFFRLPSLASYTVLSTASTNTKGKVQLTAPAELTSGAIAGLVSQDGIVSTGSDTTTNAGRGRSGRWTSMEYCRDGAEHLAGKRPEGVLCWVKYWVCEGGADGGDEFLCV